MKMKNTSCMMRTLSLILCLLLALNLSALAEGGDFPDGEEEFPVEGDAAAVEGDYAAYENDAQTADPVYGSYNPGVDMENADLVIGYVASPGASMHPGTCTELSLISINQLMYESLVDLDESMKPVPMLADSWEQDGKVWTFNLRPGVRFHNGIELTAYDVVQSYQALMTSSADNPWFSRLATIWSMDAVDILKVRVEGTTAGLATLYAMNFPVMQYQTLGELYPRGTGPYWFIQRDSQDTIRLEANPLWWKVQPGLQSLIFKRFDEAGDAIEAVHTKQIGMISTHSPKAAFSRKLADLASMDYTTLTYEMLVPNLSEKSMMADIRARQCVMYAVDRAVLASNAYLDMAIQCEVPLPPTSWLYESQSAYYYYSPERALQLMYDLGWRDLTGNGRLNQVVGVMLKEPTITIITYNESTNSIRENAAKLIAAYLDAIGFRCTVRTYSQARCRELIKQRAFDLALVAVNMSEVPSLMPMFGRQETLNLNGFGNEKMQDLLERARETSDETTLKAIYSEIQLYIVQRLPILGLVFRTGTVLANRPMGGMSALRSYDVFNGLEFLKVE